MNCTDHKILIIICTIIITIFITIIIMITTTSSSSSFEYFVACSFVALLHGYTYCSGLSFILIVFSYKLRFQYSDIHGSFRMLPESFNIWELQNNKSFKPHILQDNPLVQLYASDSGCTGDGNIRGSHFMKVFQLFLRIYSDVSSIAKAPSLQC